MKSFVRSQIFLTVFSVILYIPLRVIFKCFKELAVMTIALSLISSFLIHFSLIIVSSFRLLPKYRIPSANKPTLRKSKKRNSMKIDRSKFRKGIALIVMISISFLVRLTYLFLLLLFELKEMDHYRFNLIAVVFQVLSLLSAHILYIYSGSLLQCFD